MKKKKSHEHQKSKELFISQKKRNGTLKKSMKHHASKKWQNYTIKSLSCFKENEGFSDPQNPHRSPNTSGNFQETGLSNIHTDYAKVPTLTHCVPSVLL